jgi:BirA family biotin operon repressor/biotin-[acetyl-CoA-carboxylase] ligase
VLHTGPAAAADRHRLEHLAEAGSTNAELVTRAQQGELGPLWLVADVQVAGRGRNSRPWVSPAGNLYASLLLTDPAEPAHIAGLSFVCAVALRDAVHAAAGMHDDPRFTLKWPNDLMAEGLKAAGLLLEGGQAGGRPFVVAGFGVNIVSHPEGTAHGATHLLATGLKVDRDGLFAALSDAMALRMKQWDRGMGFQTIRRDWLRNAFGLGQPIRVTTLSRSFEATFEGIDDAGHLLARTPAGRETVSAGDVFPIGSAGGVAA